MSYSTEAKEKLVKEAGAGKFDRYGSAMKGEVLKALKEFCTQSEIFAEAVVKGRSFEECMKAVAKGVKGGSISDLTAFKLAVQYYMPSADIRFQMEIKTDGVKEEKDPSPATEPVPEQAKAEQTKSVMIDLTKFF